MWKVYWGTLTDMMFLNFMSRDTDCLGYSSACSSISGLITADATAKALWASMSFVSTLARSSLLSRTMSRN